MTQPGITTTTTPGYERGHGGTFPVVTEDVVVASGQGSISKYQVLIYDIPAGKWKKYTSPTNVASENIGSGDGTTKTFSNTLSNLNVAPGTVTVTATIGGSGVTLYDDGEGNLKDSSGSHTGTVNYVTGAISVSFGTAPDNGTNIVASYKYLAVFAGARPKIAVAAEDADATSQDVTIAAFTTGDFMEDELSPSLSSDSWVKDYLKKLHIYIH